MTWTTTGLLNDRHAAGVPAPAATVPAPAASAPALVRPEVRGKFLYAGNEKLYPRGATYGAFEPDVTGAEYHDDERIRRDFTMMRDRGFNAVRIPHTMPPRSLLDIAAECGLHVMVGLSAEQWVGYLIDKTDAPDIEAIIREKVRSVAGHPALLCYALGNEIPAPTARWIGRERVERYLERMWRIVKEEDPQGLVTYVNYPSTEYLELPFLDLLAFNVYLEKQDRLQAYIARLHSLAGDRPVIMSELGLDAMRNGEEQQAESLRWQARTVFAGGCAGAFVFSWTDEWCRAGEQVEDWAFGLTDRHRQPKPALAAVEEAFRQVPFPADTHWPRISVIVCAYNAEPTIAECLAACEQLEYPDYDVILVDDGSTDRTAEIAEQYDVKLIRTPNEGLSNARNTGLEASTGEVVAYLDSDAWPDPHWLQYLAWTYITTDAAGVGGPNIPPPGDGSIAEAVAHSPGGPIHVLLSDEVAEHIPGCNMTFRRAMLDNVGGCDPQFRTAGDDVDLCWRVQDAGGTIHFNPAAVVWHHRRNSVRMYVKQQVGYGRAEALLEAKWPERYNGLGHLAWQGRLYGAARPPWLRRVQRVYHGTWGSAPFQSLYERDPQGAVRGLSMTPEWWLLIGALGSLGVLGIAWTPLLAVLPLLGVAIALPMLHAWTGARRTWRHSPAVATARGTIWLTALLHLVQPFARLRGRLRHGLTPWRQRTSERAWLPRARECALWCEEWIDPHERLMRLWGSLKERVGPTFAGGDFDTWDLAARAALAGEIRLMMSVEDHGAGTQYVRVRYRARVSRTAVGVIAVLALVAGVALAQHAWLAGGILAGVAAVVGISILRGLGSVGAAVDGVIRELGWETPIAT